MTSLDLTTEPRVVMEAEAANRPAHSPWLFSARVDLLAFGGPALMAALLVAWGIFTGAAYGETPASLWLLCVLGVDVAHVWSTGFRVYADPQEVRRRPVLYLVGPLLAYAVAVAVHVVGGAFWFWRVLAYVAVFHFVRQQYGWMMLYRRRAGETDRAGKWLDGAAIYLCVLYPLAVWHSQPPRQFHWFIPGDFWLGLSPLCARALGFLTVATLLAYAARSFLVARKGAIPWGKHLLLATTAMCWYGGIVLFDSDYVFTVTNVLIHGVPYFFLVWTYASSPRSNDSTRLSSVIRLGWPAFYVVLVALAFAEEGLWDGLVWHDHPRLFGDWAVHPSHALMHCLVPLLALPQIMHYVWDGFVWRVGPKNPGLRTRLSL